MGFLVYLPDPKSNTGLQINPPDQQSFNKTVTGTIEEIYPSSNTLSIKESSQSAAFLLITTANTKILDRDQKTATLSALQKGFFVEAQGESTRKNTVIASQISVTNAPEIIVYQPVKEATVSAKFLVKGISHNSINTLSIRLTNSRNKAIYYKESLALKPAASSSYLQFMAEIDLGKYSSLRKNDPLILEISQESPKTNSKENNLLINLIYSP